MHNNQMVRIWREVAINWMGEELSRQSIIEKLLLSIGPRLTKEVLRALPEESRSELISWEGAQK